MKQSKQIKNRKLSDIIGLCKNLKIKDMKRLEVGMLELMYDL